MKLAKCISVIIFLIAVMGCGAHSRYSWSNYDNEMYKHYKYPAERQQFVEALKEIIDNAEPNGKVPPGIYAEYGYALFEDGNNQQAILYFEKEANKWPESRAFMTKLITIANNRTKIQKENTIPPTGPTADTSANSSKATEEVSK